MYVHGCKSKNCTNDGLGPDLHLQFPHNEDGQCSEDPICHRIQYGYNIGGVDHECGVQTFARVGWFEIPPERDWTTLEKDNGAVDGSSHDTADHDDSDDPNVQWFHGNSQEEEADGDLEHGGCQCIEEFTEEPKLSFCQLDCCSRLVLSWFTDLQGCLSMGISEVFTMPSGSICNASILADEVSIEEGKADEHAPVINTE